MNGLSLGQLLYDAGHSDGLAGRRAQRRLRNATRGFAGVASYGYEIYRRGYDAGVSERATKRIAERATKANSPLLCRKEPQ